MLKRVFKGQERKYIDLSYGNLTIKSLAVSLRTTRFNIQISTWCPLCVECFVWISETDSDICFIQH